MQKEKLTVLFTVLVDVLGFGIVIPILPFYVTSFGASAFTVTLLFSSFALFAFVSSPFLGALSDKIGRRPVLIFSIASTAIGWFVFAAADSIVLLFIGRIIDGAAAGNFTVAQSALVDISTDEKDRAANLGLIGASFGIGFMLGPLIGGVLSTVSLSCRFWRFLPSSFRTRSDSGPSPPDCYSLPWASSPPSTRDFCSSTSG